MEKIIICPSCNDTNLKDLFTCKDYFLSQESFSLIQCNNCKLIITNPQPDKHEIIEYYKSDNYISHKSRTSSFFDSIYNTARKISINRKVKLINQLNLDRSILDFGCGTGAFLDGCSKQQWRIDGIEPNKQARQAASALLNYEIKSGLNELNPNAKVSIITLWYVLEHVHNLHETLAQLYNILHEKGKLIIAVPNHESYDAQYYKQYWAAYDVPRHLYHFSRTSMDILLQKHNYHIEKILPMKFDPFYISLLSEKYKNGHKNWFTSMLTGYKSNIYGKKTGNYSSLIYIAAKC